MAAGQRGFFDEYLAIRRMSLIESGLDSAVEENIALTADSICAEVAAAVAAAPLAEENLLTFPWQLISVSLRNERWKIVVSILIFEIIWNNCMSFV